MLQGTALWPFAFFQACLLQGPDLEFLPTCEPRAKAEHAREDEKCKGGLAKKTDGQEWEHKLTVKHRISSKHGADRRTYVPKQAAKLCLSSLYLVCSVCLSVAFPSFEPQQAPVSQSDEKSSDTSDFTTHPHAPIAVHKSPQVGPSLSSTSRSP